MLSAALGIAVPGCEPASAAHESAAPSDDAAEGEGEPSEGEGEGEGEGCVIGDRHAPAELELVLRTTAGEIAPLPEGGDVPLQLPIQGGKVIYVGVAGINVSCNVQLMGGLFDDCQDPPAMFAVEGRPVLLAAGDDGRARPVNEPSDFYVGNFANLPVCPSFASMRDADAGTWRIEMRVTEERRAGETAPREHVLTSTLKLVCADADCACECDADFSTELTRDEQCPTIDDNDPPPGECPLP